MTRTAPNRRADNVAASLHHLAVDITRAVEHVHAELDHLGAYPTDTLPRTHQRRRRHIDLAARQRPHRLRAPQPARGHPRLDRRTRAVRTLRPTHRRRNHEAPNRPTRLRLGGSRQRCSGRIDATCEQWASEQRLADGTSIDTLCIDCFAKAASAAVTNPQHSGAPTACGPARPATSGTCAHASRAPPTRRPEPCPSCPISHHQARQGAGCCDTRSVPSRCSTCRDGEGHGNAIRPQLAGSAHPDPRTRSAPMSGARAAVPRHSNPGRPHRPARRGWSQARSLKPSSQLLDLQCRAAEHATSSSPKP